jgi:hypothetical protein
VAEWSNAPDSKSGLRLCRNVGSNPTLSATQTVSDCARLQNRLKGRNGAGFHAASWTGVRETLGKIGQIGMRLRTPNPAVRFVFLLEAEKLTLLSPICRKRTNKALDLQANGLPTIQNALKNVQRKQRSRRPNVLIVFAFQYPRCSALAFEARTTA